MQRDGLTLGWGMAGCSWLATRFPAEASVELRADGTARVASGTQHIGTGTYTILAQLVAEKTGLPLDRIEDVLGDAALPAGPISGDSMATGSLVPAVFAAADKAIATLLDTAATAPGSPFAKRKRDELAFADGRVFAKKDGRVSGVALGDLLTRANVRPVTGSGRSEGTFDKKDEQKLSTHSFGAHLVEVTWQPEIARLRVSRVVAVIDAGRILNPLAGRNQIEDAVVMGIGMALFEETIYDPRYGTPINSNLADYVVAVNADVPPPEVHFLDYPDAEINPLGTRRIGEIGLAGVAAAITAAVHHATGVRVRKLPVRIEHLLARRAPAARAGRFVLPPYGVFDRGRPDIARDAHLLRCSTPFVPEITRSVAMPMKKPCSTTPARSLMAVARRATSGIGPKAQSRIMLPESVR